MLRRLALPRAIGKGSMIGIRSYSPISLLRHALCAIAAAVVLVGCSSPVTRGFARDGGSSDAEVERHVKRGYVSDHAYATDTVDAAWTIDGEPIAVSLMLPAGNDRFPLVVYLPGLGENAQSGLAWRKTWAQAGYAVLSVQPASEGVAVWKSEQARLGDFRAVARAHFGASSLARRARLLEGVFAELVRRVADAWAFARIDMQAIALAGFDLGSQTAMIVAGERVDGVEALHWPAAVKAVIALSPYADFSGMGVAHDFEAIEIPVLGVTSGQDTDAYGLVTSPSVRRAPFRYMPAGDKYLLVLAGAPHSLMSGRETPETSMTETPGGENGGTAGREQLSRGGGMRGRRGTRDSSGEAVSRAGPPLVNWKMELADAKSVSTAFLDATVKGDPVAREWLQKDAQRWLGDLAQLSSK